MAQISFIKIDQAEVLNRLRILGSSGSTVTLWEKGKGDKSSIRVVTFDKDRMEIILDTLKEIFPKGTLVLCSFEMSGMNFFSEVIFQSNLTGHICIYFKNIIYRSERRSSFRLSTYPAHEIWAEFVIKSTYEGGKVVDLKSRSSQTSLFKDFLKILSDESKPQSSEKTRIRIQNLSATGFSAEVGEIENGYFKKDMIINDVNLNFKNEWIHIPLTRIVYVVELSRRDESQKKFRLGCHFENLSLEIDEKISNKINELLRYFDLRKDFEKFVK